MKIKLCGFVTKETIDFALKYQPDFMGFIFYPPSKRHITFDQAREISKINFGKTAKTAVIVNENNQNISQIIDNLKPDYLQLHGEEAAQRCQEIKDKFNLPIIKSIAISNDSDPIKIQKNIKNYHKIANFLLFDTKTSQKGGSGHNFDWKILPKLYLEQDYFLSGGINIDNIAQAAKISNAKIFDLSSGIEEIKGVKSLDKIKNLMEFWNEFNKA